MRMRMRMWRLGCGDVDEDVDVDGKIVALNTEMLNNHSITL
jgi:hypothetical protein